MNAVEAEQLFGKMLDGEMSDDAIKATLIEMAERDETSEEIAGAIRAMRARMIRVTAPEGAIDVCGTGGDGAHSLNVSTAVAIVVADQQSGDQCLNDHNSPTRTLRDMVEIRVSLSAEHMGLNALDSHTNV